MIGCRTKNKLLKNWQENKILQPLASDREISLQSIYNILNSRSVDKKEICKLRMFQIYIYIYICIYDKASRGRVNKNPQTKPSNLLGCALFVFLERGLISKIELSAELIINKNYET